MDQREFKGAARALRDGRQRFDLGVGESVTVTGITRPIEVCAIVK